MAGPDRSRDGRLTVVLWRISNHATLDGLGGMRASGRWSSRGHPVVYCAPDPSTALLETLVHLEIDVEDLPDAFQWLRISVPGDIALDRTDIKHLPQDWSQHPHLTQVYGDRWLADGTAPLLRVPSVLVPETWNVLLNPRHPAATRCAISATYLYPLDTRLSQRPGCPS
ncbi:RES domain protein [Acidithiobacillus ferrivorans]|uniref:RES domain protein n=1 Tax=Acidithiobacillus ferrivorans TaxID=160808 RepID=A0A060UUQ8_9PROT|nr:RES family NAD+ phosphorylase [Acidithiobacillus ferrivorans]CDQ10314.1 RES domain protein [Acidithiobacillus ferrivorans]SMH64341.1 RES domain protein [Acidithiobacillus ferrivorans]